MFCNSVQAQDCNIVRVDLELDSKAYVGFVDDLNSFYKSSYEYDIIMLKVKGGNRNKSYLSRYYFDDKWITYKNEAGKLVDKEEFVIDNLYMDTLLQGMNLGSYLNLCPLSSSNDSYIYMIKKEEKIVFRYHGGYPLAGKNQDIKGLEKVFEMVKLID